MRLLLGDAREKLRDVADESAHCCVTSPPYWGLRDYGIPPSVWGGGWEGCLGLEPTPDLYIAHLVEVFREVKRVLRKDGVVWLNLGDSYSAQRWTDNSPQRMNQYRDVHRGIAPEKDAGLPAKNLCLMPFRVALALQDEGWWVRSCIPWIKPNPMPESVTDRPTCAVEYIFLLARSERYFYDADAVRKGQTAISLARAAWEDSRTTDEGWKSRNRQGGMKANEVKLNPAGRNRRNSDWFLDSLRGLLTDDEGDPLALVLPTQAYPGAHFATFPRGLVEPCILAGTSAKGVCPKCGAGWERVVERATESHPNRWSKAADAQQFDAKANVYGKASALGVAHTSATLGWRSTCNCEAGDPIPATVLDPFAGSGTVGEVAQYLGRDAILIEYDKYLPLIRQRCGLGLEMTDA